MFPVGFWFQSFWTLRLTTIIMTEQPNIIKTSFWFSLLRCQWSIVEVYVFNLSHPHFWCKGIWTSNFPNTCPPSLTSAKFSFPVGSLSGCWAEAYRTNHWIENPSWSIFISGFWKVFHFALTCSTWSSISFKSTVQLVQTTKCDHVEEVL